MNITPDHKLEGVPYSPAADSGEAITPEAILIHYTAAGPAAGTIAWLTRHNGIVVSAHIVIARDGAITQLVPFNRKALHAGISQWEGRLWLNNWSIGIELANWGLLVETSPADQLQTWTSQPLDRSICAQAPQKLGPGTAWWERYPNPQITACVSVCAALAKRYAIKTILGHDDVSPDRKVDPGPLFPMDDVRRTVLELEDPDDVHAPYHLILDAIAEALGRFRELPP